MIDGRRIFLVGGTIDYTRTPRQRWAERIQAARQAGLNTITTNVVWSRHEPRAGSFDFGGEADLKHFVELIGAAGMYSILRVGPYIGSGLDLGGLPVWLLSAKEVKLRTANTAFLEATSRYVSAVANQVRDLQATATESGPGGPIILVQAESAWTCGDDALAPQYLGEINRYLREAGFDVPIINANNLWQGLEAEIDTWTGNTDMLSNLRQIAAVRPAIPRLVSAFTLGEVEHWGAPARKNPAMDEQELQRELAEVLAAAGQFNVEPFAGGSNFGFTAGRTPGGQGLFTTASNDQSAPLDESGKPGPLYEPLRRIAMFASRFGRVLANLDPRRGGVNLVPESVFSLRNPKAPSTGHVVSYAAGPQGSVAFVFGSRLPGDGPARETPAQLLMNDGGILPVYMGQNQVTWCLFDVRLAGRSQLDYCNLAAFALVGKVFVVAGPAGSPVRLAINGSPLETDVPEGDEPEAIEHENMLVVICSEKMISKLLVADDAVYMGAEGLTPEGLPIVRKAEREVLRYSADGTVARVKYHPPQPARKVKVSRVVMVVATGKGKSKKPQPQTIVEELMQEGPRSPVALIAPPKPPAAPALGDWRTAALEDYVSGESARFASIKGPGDLAALGAPYGYGWYRAVFKSPTAGRVLIAAPGSGDRLHMFLDGVDAGILGIGPGAAGVGDMTLSVRKRKEHSLVVLAENLGRFAGGQHLGEGKGLVKGLWEVAPARGIGKPTVRSDKPIEALGFKTPLLEVHSADVTDSARMAWEWAGKRKHDVLVKMNLEAGAAQRGVIVLNGKPIQFFDCSGPGTLVISAEDMSRTGNMLEIALLASARADLKPMAAALEFFDLVEDITAASQWAFAKWEVPADSAFAAKLPRGVKGPVWSKSKFTGPALLGPDLRVTLTGLSKGQLYANGKHVGRYFVSTAKGKPVGPATEMLVPASMLSAGGANELMVFDEHGMSASKVRATWVI
ncbi:hypothetical protein BH11PLA1_BH11PLA1_16300 [soil metagenome]